MPPNKWGASIVGASALSNQFKTFRGKLNGPVVYSVGTPVRYSVFVEMGTSRMAAQPYLRPAVERARRDINQIFSNAASLAAGIATLALRIVEIAKRLCPVDTGTLRASIVAQQLSG